MALDISVHVHACVEKTGSPGDKATVLLLALTYMYCVSPRVAVLCQIAVAMSVMYRLLVGVCFESARC